MGEKGSLVRETVISIRVKFHIEITAKNTPSQVKPLHIRNLK